MRKLWGVVVLLIGVLAGLGALSVSLGIGSAPRHHFELALAQAHPWATAQQGPAQTFPTSLHATREGKRTWYGKENGGFETLTNVPIEKLGCLGCHPGTYADGTKVDPATYTPSCKDCHVQPGDKVKQETCLKCHSRQGLEMKLYSDVHRAKNMECSSCHTSREMHGDGKTYKSWLEPGAMDVACEKCHTTVSTTVSHAIHQKTVDCATCHSQSVVACYNCHLDSAVAVPGTKRFYGPVKDFTFLLNRQGKGKVYSGTIQTLVHGGKTFVALAPFRGHTISKQGRGCAECHNNAVIQEYIKTGKITVSKWDGSKLVFTSGVIPVPPDWKTALLFDFVNYTGDITKPETDPTKWVFLKSGADLMQMLYGDPLTKEQIEKLKQAR